MDLESRCVYCITDNLPPEVNALASATTSPQFFVNFSGYALGKLKDPGFLNCGISGRNHSLHRQGRLLPSFRPKKMKEG
ncbi:hypothetical protein AKJ60_01040 [candidate division MSBL1 archaeon SCGC-AAA385M11]|nr:hypothetical protein AKJ60_01040 [candidate division MSBL1 archaeon SCGC-AAA385M11]